MTVRIAKNVDSWCTRCKLVLAHTIEAMAGGKITRVHCNTCGGQHAYRAEPPRTRAATGRGSSSQGVGRTINEQTSRPGQYEALLRGRTAAAARPYSTSARFKAGELISHATFGLGAVTGERDNIKIEVLFPDGPRVLLQGH